MVPRNLACTTQNGVVGFEKSRLDITEVRSEDDLVVDQLEGHGEAAPL